MINTLIRQDMSPRQRIYFLLLVAGFCCANSSVENREVYTQAFLNIKYKPLNSMEYLTKKMAGKFAEQSTKQNVRGILYYSDDWCNEPQDIKLNPNIPLNRSWIALIPLGNTQQSSSCLLTEKILTAKKLNANGVVVTHNEVNGEVPVLQDDTHDVITVMINFQSGEELRNLILDKEIVDEMQCTVSVGTRFVDRQWSNRKNSILAVIIIPGIIGVALILITIWWLLTKRRNGL
uniref:Uncharacterized protein n=1 Tax=Clytia hemisphaerica TaxID=252671 RepID=A0A7M5V8X8_9CNID